MNTTEIVDIVLAVQRATQKPTAEPPMAMGQNIVILDRGFVYVGDVTIDGDFLRIDNAKNIRRWGTSNGLGELRNGPLDATVLDECGKALAPIRSLIHLIPCKGF